MSNPLASDRYAGLEPFVKEGFGEPFNGASPQTLTVQLPSEGTWFGDLWATCGSPNESAWITGTVAWWPGVTYAGSQPRRLLTSQFGTLVKAERLDGQDPSQITGLSVSAPSATGVLSLTLAFNRATAVSEFSLRLYKIRSSRPDAFS